MNQIVKCWYSKSPLCLLLWPLSALYQMGFFLHKLSYSIGLKKSFCAPKPVIVVGNITVGGTGKTPFTTELAHILAANGYRPGIISRGYKGLLQQGATRVTSDSNPLWVGDEAVLLARQSGCPVVVSPKRSKAINMLLANSECNVIISDDGLQHHAIKKDVEIVIIDGERKFGNGMCLPAGPLREPLRKLAKVDFIVYHDENVAKHTYSMTLSVGEIYNLKNSALKLTTFNKEKVHAVAAIGHPERFFNSLRRMGLDIESHIFSDHHQFKPQDFKMFRDEHIIIMTEKDAVKCKHFAQPNFWVLPVRCQISTTFTRDILLKLQALAR